MIQYLNHLKLWSDTPGRPGMIPATQADLDALRAIINQQADVINALIDICARTAPAGWSEMTP